MTSDNKFGLRNIFKSMAPAVSVVIAGVVGAYLVYDNYLSDRMSAAQVSGYEPAAGDENNTMVSPGVAAQEVGTVKDNGAAPKPVAGTFPPAAATSSSTNATRTTTTTTTAPATGVVADEGADSSGAATTTTTTTSTDHSFVSGYNGGAAGAVTAPQAPASGMDQAPAPAGSATP